MIRTHRHPKNRIFLDRCERIAKAHPDWDVAKVMARATLEGLVVNQSECICNNPESWGYKCPVHLVVCGAEVSKR